MKTQIHANVKNMSIKDMERVIFDILTDNGMSDDDADKTVKNMSIKDMERYLTDAYDSVEDDESET